MAPISEFVYHRQVQYRETDASGLVHFSMFFVYAEEAEHAMWRSVGLSVEPAETTIGWPRVSAAFDFLKPLRFEDRFEVHLRVIGKTSKTFTYQVVIKLSEQVAAMGTVTSICVRKVAGEPIKAIDIPAGIADRFAVTTAVESPRLARR